ncbi:sigma factor, partial [Nocardia brasiliensis]|uniref:sigma factor n=1 Tax=Nocardia brasiliensis TaxID=37326 RepID=UPI0022858BA3
MAGSLQRPSEVRGGDSAAIRDESSRSLTDSDWQTHRAAVYGVAYRILGTVTEAEDVTQEVWLRVATVDISAVRDLRAWLVTLSARTSYN